MSGATAPFETALVTGAGTGIGREVAKELARRGALVYVTGLALPEAEAVAGEIAAEGHRAIAAQLDVTDSAALESALQRVADEQGRLDLLVNNAGTVYVGEFYDMDEAFVRKLIDVNLTAVTLGTLYAYRIMKAQGHGLIANVSSAGGLVPAGAMAAYSATKHGVVGLTAAVSGEARAHGVELKTICPGHVTSELIERGARTEIDTESALQTLPGEISTEKAARIIVDGLSRRPRRILFPFYVRLIDLLQRLWPGFSHRGAAHSIELYRQRRGHS